jgi:tetratricopeptide (TPR) repeat protein
VPYEKNEHFTGRQGLLAKLCEKLCVAVPKRYNHRVALHGLGGVGKTQIALEYVYTHKALHDRIYWISGVDKASLLSGYEEIGKRTGCIKNHGDLSPSDVAKTVLSWLNKEEGWLLVVDNVDDSAVVDGYLPERSPRQLTLLTTRNPNTDEYTAESFEVDVLEKNDAIDLLSVRSGAEIDENKPEAEEIVREVGCLPLAIEQAAAYIREVSKDIFQFLPSYRNNRKCHHSRTPKGNWKYGESIASTWHLSFKQVEQNNKGASRLLQLLAFLNPDGIYTDFLEAGKDALETGLQTVIGDPDTFHEALFELERFSLIRRQLCDSSQRITIHRLVQLVIIDAMDQSDSQSMMAQVIRLGISAFPDPTLLSSNPNSLELSRRYRSQVMACLRHRELGTSADVWNTLSVRVAGFLYFDGYYDDCARLASLTVEASKICRGPDHPETLQSMDNLAATFRKLARAHEARKLFQETLATRTRVLGPHHLETLQSMHGLGWAYVDLAQPSDAVKLHKESLAIKRKVLGNDHRETALSMDGLASAYWKLGEYHEAAVLHEETLEIFKKIHGLGHVDTLASMNGLGWAKWRLGRYEEAAQLFQDSLNNRKEFQRDDHPDTLSSLDGLAWSYWRLGQYEKATSVFQDTLELNKRMLGPEHPDTAMNLYGLAWGHWRLGRYTQAFENFQEAHDITTRILGPHHPDTLLNSDGLAWCYWRFGDYDKSLQLHQETLDYYRKKLGHNHSDTMFSLYGLAWSQWSLRNYKEAESLFQERLAICSATLYPDHRDALMSKHGLASTYEKLGRYDEAVALFSETLKKRKEALAPEHPEILESMDGLACAYRGIRRLEDSIQLFQETLSLRQRIFGEEHPETLQTLHGLAMSFHESGRCVDAQELYIKTWRGRESILGQNHPDTLNCMNDLAQCYHKHGCLDKAHALSQKIIARRNQDSIPTQVDIGRLSDGFTGMDVGV